MSPLFTFDQIKSYYPNFLDTTDSIIADFLKSEEFLEHKPVKICHLFMRITGEAVFRAFFGEKNELTEDGIPLP